jgi:hypothetical protein
MLTKLSKVLKLNKFSLRNISGNRQSRDNREKRELAKLEKFWRDFDKKIDERRELEKKIEAKYSPEEVLLGAEKYVSEDLKTVYYIPLTIEDEGLLDRFTTKAIESIKRGGRIVLKDEIEAHNTENPGNKIPFDFVPMTLDEVNEIKTNFPHLYKDSKAFNFALQNGKPFFAALKSYKDETLRVSNSFLSHLRYAGHYSTFGGNLNPPFNTKVSAEFPKQPDPHYIKVLLQGKLNEEQLCEKLKSIYFNYYNALEEASKEKTQIPSLSNAKLNTLSGVVDSTMLQRTKVILDYLQMNNLNISCEKERINAPPDTCYIFDKLLIKGVMQDRSKNLEAKDYINVDTHEDMGIRYFMNKVLASTDKNEALLSLLTENNTEVDTSVAEANKTFLLRVTLLIKHPYKLKIGHSVLEYPSDYTYTHLAVFENQLISPHSTFLVKHDFEEWLARHEVDPNGWKLVDVDNFMKGNSFFKEITVFEDELNEDLESKERLWEYIEGKFVDFKLPDDKKAGKGTKSVDKSSEKKAKQQPSKKDENEKDIVGNYRVIKIKEYQPNEFEKLLDSSEVQKTIEKEIKIDEAKLNKIYETIENLITNNVSINFTLKTTLNKEQLTILSKAYLEDLKMVYC